MKTGWSLFLLALAVSLVSTGCTGTIYPADGGQQTPTFLINSIELSGTTIDDCTVSVADLPDDDGTDDKSWQAAFNLDDSGDPKSLPVDDGSRWQQTLMIKATRKSDGQVFYKKATITLYTGSSSGS